MFFVSHSPMPVPLSPLMVNKGSKMCRMSGSAIPQPVSAIVNCAEPEVHYL